MACDGGQGYGPDILLQQQNEVSHEPPPPTTTTHTCSCVEHNDFSLRNDSLMLVATRAFGSRPNSSHYSDHRETTWTKPLELSDP